MNQLSDINEYIQSLKASKRLGTQVVFHGELPEKEACFARVEKPWPEEIERALLKSDIRHLYNHQTQAINNIRSGNHTVVATATASGKTLIYNLPVMEQIIADPGAKALYIFPLKALAQDQLFGFNRLSGHMESVIPSAAIYDGDTTSWHRKKIRSHPPNVLLTNPEMLHLSLIPYHENWGGFFSQLKLVVVDEVHTYRGVMGSHMAQVFRRLLRICSHYGASPIFVFCSATISNPGELANQLTGLEISEITESGAPQGKRHMIFMDPVDGSSQIAIQLLKAALHRELRTIVYTQSRKMTELISMWVQSRAGEYKNRISAYRAGFLPEERRQIEHKLANGDLLAVISTSALELGIDIGDLDLCLLVGYPGTVVSTLQRGGRVGRSGQDSATVLIAGEDALDQYFMRHPNHLIKREPEAAVINPNNPNIVSSHLVCAAAELPLRPDEPYANQKETVKLIATLEENGELLKSGDGDAWYSNRKRPQRYVDLRGSGDTYTIVHGESGDTIGEIDAFRAFKETHPGAIYLHMGTTYQVTHLDLGTKTAKAVPAKGDYYTRAMAHKDTEILTIYEEKYINNTLVCTGRVKVTEQVTGYEKWTIYGKKRLNRFKLDLPPIIFESDGIWFRIPKEISESVESKFMHFMGGIHAVEHAAIGIFPLLVLTDRNDLGGISTPFHPQLDGPAVFIYDAVSGGAGLVRQAFKSAKKLLEYTLSAIKDCTCENGCPSCVHSPKCGSGNRPIDKAAAVFVIRQMLNPDNRDMPSLDGGVISNLPLGQPRITPLNNIDTNIIGIIPEDEPFEPPRNLDHRFAGLAEDNESEIIQRAGKKSIQRLRRKRRKGILGDAYSENESAGKDSEHNFRYAVLDIETQRSAQEVGGWHRADLMRVSCVVLYDSKTHEYLEFMENQVQDLIGMLTEFDVIVGFNIKRFDYKVLSGYTNYDFKTLATLDILEDVHAHLGYRLSLDHLAGVTLGTQKTGDGLQALRWWKEGKIREIIEYCRKDVEITRALFKYGRDKGHLLFTNKAKQTVRIPVKWQRLWTEIKEPRARN